MTQLAHAFPRFEHVAVTQRLADPTSDLLVRRIALLRDCVALAQQRYPFEIEAATVLPSEIHLLVRLEPGGAMAPRLRLIRSAFSRHSGEPDAAHLWDREVEEAIVPLSALESRKALLLNAPVRAGLVAEAVDWAFSSLHRRGAPRPVSEVA